jgi:redox-sensing transcriptional repressor
MRTPARLPRPTVERLSLYLRELERAGADAASTVSSRQLGLAAGATDAQVRKDLGFVGVVGRSGVGYARDRAVEAIRRAIGMHRPWRAVLVGAGNIGRALAAYGRFREEGFVIVAIIDRAPSILGRQVAGIEVRPMEQLARAVRSEGVDIGIIAVPGEEAQGVADALVAAGVRGVLNFAPTRLNVDGRVPVVEVDFRAALERLAAEVSQRDGDRRAAATRPTGSASPAVPARRPPRRRPG